MVACRGSVLSFQQDDQQEYMLSGSRIEFFHCGTLSIHAVIKKRAGECSPARFAILSAALNLVGVNDQPDPLPGAQR
jgi:hypothetical protein